MSNSIESELERCRQSAEEGYSLANGKYVEIKRTLTDATKQLEKTDKEQRQVTQLKNTELVEAQEHELRRLTTAVRKIGNDLQNLRGRTQEFSIVVYGRTKAGKSTLMEILTQGNGKSIGKGRQRTTRDVRDYHWNGLKITDVPGICAFEGAEDEQLALEAAKAADLILFLLTNDAPQPDEAACLAQLKSFGKPILGVMNVKTHFHINDDMDIEDLQSEMTDTRNADAAINQFKEYAAKHNQDWSDIKFVTTHLLSAYEAQRVNNPAVFEMSRFAEVENFILDKVRADGRFLRIKTFADAVAVPMSRIVLKIYEQSAASLEESDIWFEKRRNLNAWSENFATRAQTRIDNLYKQLSAQLDEEIDDFVDYHYEDEKAGEHWQTKFKELKFDDEYRKLLNNLAKECQRKCTELSDELAEELPHLALANDPKTKVQMSSTTPWTKYGAGVLSGVGGFILARGAGVVFPPLGIALTVVGILGAIFGDSKDEQIRENKKKLRDAIKKPSDGVLKNMRDEVKKTFNTEILKNGIYAFRNSLAKYQFMIARLGKSQGGMAAKLFVEFSDLNAKLSKPFAKFWVVNSSLKNIRLTSSDRAKRRRKLFRLYSGTPSTRRISKSLSKSRASRLS